MRGTLCGVILCNAIVFWVQSAFGEEIVINEIDVKIIASHDFGNYKLGEYNRKLVIGCALNDYSNDFQHMWKWFHNDQEIKMDYVTPHPFIVSGNLLIISYLNESTVGKYTCKLLLDEMIEMDSKDINVIMKPSLDINRVQLFNPGEPISLKCSVQGVPTPMITWEFENETIVPSENVSISTDVNGNSILHIKAADYQHTGMYNCLGRFANILPTVKSDPCNVFSEDNVEEFVNMTTMLEAELDHALELASKVEVELHVAKARLFNSVLWLKLTGRWTRNDHQWIYPFQQNLLESELTVIEAKTATLVSTTHALESHDRNADPQTHMFSMADEVEKLAAAGVAARKLETLLSEELADVNWLMEAIAIRTSGRKTPYVMVAQSVSNSQYNVMASFSK